MKQVNLTDIHSSTPVSRPEHVIEALLNDSRTRVALLEGSFVRVMETNTFCQLLRAKDGKKNPVPQILDAIEEHFGILAKQNAENVFVQHIDDLGAIAMASDSMEDLARYAQAIRDVTMSFGIPLEHDIEAFHVSHESATERSKKNSAKLSVGFLAKLKAAIPFVRTEVSSEGKIEVSQEQKKALTDTVGYDKEVPDALLNTALVRALSILDSQGISMESLMLQRVVLKSIMGKVAQRPAYMSPDDEAKWQKDIRSDFERESIQVTGNTIYGGAAKIKNFMLKLVENDPYARNPANIQAGEILKQSLENNQFDEVYRIIDVNMKGKRDYSDPKAKEFLNYLKASAIVAMVIQSYQNDLDEILYQVDKISHQEVLDREVPQKSFQLREQDLKVGDSGIPPAFKVFRINPESGVVHLVKMDPDNPNMTNFKACSPMDGVKVGDYLHIEEIMRSGLVVSSTMSDREVQEFDRIMSTAKPTRPELAILEDEPCRPQEANSASKPPALSFHSGEPARPDAASASSGVLLSI